MPYENTPGIKGSYVDGALVIPRGTNQPRILVVGSGSSGDSNELFAVRGSAEAESEFGSTSDLVKGMHELFAQGASNIAIMRSGGQQGSFVLSRGTETLTIVPSQRDDAVFDRYALIIEDDGSGGNRYLIFDIESQSYVYDTLEIEVINDDDIAVTDTGLAATTSVNTRAMDPASLTNMSDVTGATEYGALYTATITQGTDGQQISLAERYAALNSTYHNLDYKDMDMIYPIGVFIDDANLVTEVAASELLGTPSGSTDIGNYGVFWWGVPVPESGRDYLGYLWQYVYQGRLYTYMVDTSDYFSVTGVAATATISTDFVVTAARVGKWGNAITVEITNTGSAGLAVSVVEDTFSMVVTINLGGDTYTTDNLVTDATTQADSLTLENGDVLSDAVTFSGGDSATSAATASSVLAGGVGGAVLTHEDLTGDTIPSAVSTKFTAGSDSELRECNFAHQLATFCWVASTTWKDVLGAISFKAPGGYDRPTIADWVGSLPTYSDNGTEEYIDSAADDGSGLLGNRFLAGEAGYRTDRVTDSSASEGLAYGGFILTTSDSLPNGSEYPYGISDADEASDRNEAPVDIGKHIIPVAAWPILSTAYNGRSVYRGPIAAAVLAKLAQLPSNVEPIGEAGVLRRIRSTPRVHASQIDGLSKLGIATLRRDEGIGYSLVKVRTAAHPTSDYAKVSTIRSVNSHLKGIRRVGRPFIGKAFSTEVLVSMKGEIDLFLAAMRTRGFNSGAVVSFSYSRADKIMGNLTVRLRMVPPFSLEAITVETTLAADESEL